MQKRAAACVLLVCTSLLAQDARGRITGRITDPSNASMAGVEVTARNQANGTVVTARSSESGSYELPYLQPALYTLTVTAPGFRKYERINLEVRVDDRLAIDIPLQLGDVGDAVTVSGQPSLLETGTASLGQVVDTRRILELPLPGGNALSLARLSPGVVNLASPNHPSLGPAVEVLSQISVNGVRSGNVEFTVDGTPSMWGTNAAYAPPADMVAEFKVQTATYDAGFGHAPGGNINVVLRSGANKFHGSLYEFHNDQVLTAMDLFQRQNLYNPATGPVTDAKRQQANPRNILNRFGGTLAGPVRIPSLYDGRNKTFWIYGFEMLTRPGVERGNTFFNVPPLKQRQGDFSDLLALGPSYQIYDPATIAPAPGGRFSRQPFPSNVIPKNRLDPVALGLLKYFPEPNTSGAPDGRNNFTRLQRSFNEFRSHTAKIDHNFSDRHRSFLRYNQTYNLFSSGQIFQNDATGNDRFRYNYGAGFDDVYVFNPSLLMNFRYGFTRFEQTFRPLAAGFDLTGAGFSPALAAGIDPQARTIPQIQIAGLQTLGTQFPSQSIGNNHTFADDLTWSRGQHTIRAGAEYRLYRVHNYNFNFGTPQLTFGNTYTRGPLDSAAGAPVGQGLASFLLGVPTDGQLNVNDSYAEQSAAIAFFVQDDWRVSGKLTINAGLRYDYDVPPTERFNRSVRGFDFQTPNPIQARALAAYAQSPLPELPAGRFSALGGLTFAGVNGQPRSLWSGDANNFAPRIGLTWSPVKNTVIRSGYGIFFVPMGVDRTNVNQSGYTVRNSLVPSLDNGLTFTASLANPFPAGVLQPAGASGGLLTDVGRTISFFNPQPRNGYMQRFSFDVQQQLPGSVMTEIGYVGNRGTKLAVTRQLDPIPVDVLSRSGVRDQATIDRLTLPVLNPFFPLPGTDIAGRTVARYQLLRPFPQFSGIATDEPIGYSWYHSLQFRADRRFSRGFTAQFNYTWSKFMEATGFLNPGDASLERVISDLDRTHRVAFSGVWELPFGRGRALLSRVHPLVDSVAGGWQLQGVYQRNTGAPLSFGNAILTGDIRTLPLSAGQTLDRWFNPAIFNRNPAEQLQLNYRTLSTRFSGARRPAQETCDLSAIKNFHLRETLNLQFRGEFLNALNRSNLAAPNTDPVNSLFGRITATDGFPRQIHLALKLSF